MVEAEGRWLKKEGETIEAKHKKAEQENEQLRKEMEELRAGFDAKKKELEDEYQKQMDDIFFFFWLPMLYEKTWHHSGHPQLPFR